MDEGSCRSGDLREHSKYFMNSWRYHVVFSCVSMSESKKKSRFTNYNRSYFLQLGVMAMRLNNIFKMDSTELSLLLKKVIVSATYLLTVPLMQLWNESFICRKTSGQTLTLMRRLTLIFIVGRLKKQKNDHSTSNLVPQSLKT